jgi:hypothetical protein
LRERLQRHPFLAAEFTEWQKRYSGKRDAVATKMALFKPNSLQRGHAQIAYKVTFNYPNFVDFYFLVWIMAIGFRYICANSFYHEQESYPYDFGRLGKIA